MYKLLIIGVAIATVSCDTGITYEDKQRVRELIRPFIPGCANAAGISIEEIKQAEANNALPDLDPCFLACLYKEVNMVDGDGMLDVEQGLAVAAQIFNGEALDRVSAHVKSCEIVNYASVNDGSAGCDRSRLIAHCLFGSKSV